MVAPDPKDRSDLTRRGGSTAAQAFGDSVRRARKDAGLTQQELADLAGLSDRTIRQIENGSGSPGLGSALTVLDVLGLRAVVEP